MKKKKRNKLPKIENAIYLNANIIYSQIINEIKNRSGLTLFKLGQEYHLTTSVLTRHEVVQNLHKNRSISITDGRKLYMALLKKFKIAEISSIHKKDILTDEFFEKATKCGIHLKDAIHLRIAEKQNKMVVCTHDKKMKDNYPQHETKLKFYPHVYKPEQLIKPKK